MTPGRPTGLLTGFLSLSAARLVSAALSFALVVVVARRLGPEALGAYSFVLGVFVLLQYLPTMGLHVAVTRNTAVAPHQARAQLVNGALLALPATGLAVLGLAAVSPWIAPGGTDVRVGLLLVAASLVPTAVTTLFEAVLVGHEQSARVARVSLLETVGRSLASLAAVRAGFGVEALFVVFALGRVLAALVYLRIGIAQGLLQAGLVDRSTLRGLAAQLPVFFSIMLLAQLMERLDFLVLGALAGVRELGLYAAPYKVYELLLMAPRIASLVLLPRFAGCLQRCPEGFDALVRAVLRIGLAVALPAALLAAFFAPEAMAIFGRGYPGGADVLALLCLAAVGVVLNGVLSIVLIVTGNQRSDLRALGIAAAVYATLLIVLVPVEGARGAAIATLVVAFVQPAMALAMLRRRLAGAPVAAALLRVAAAGAALAATLWLATPLAWPWRAAAALALYAAVLHAAGAPMRGDWRHLRHGLQTRHAA